MEILFSYYLDVHCLLFLSWCPLIVSMLRFLTAPDFFSLSLFSPLLGSETMSQKSSGMTLGLCQGRTEPRGGELGLHTQRGAGKCSGREGGVLSSLSSAHYPTLLLILQLSL